MNTSGFGGDGWGSLRFSMVFAIGSISGGAPSQIVQLYAAEDASRGRNDPRPCGSGRKWKRCHGAA